MYRKLLIVMGLMVCLTVSGVMAQQSVQLTVEQGSFAPYHPDYLALGSEIVLSLRVVNNSPEPCTYTPSFGWHLFSLEGVQWYGLKLTSTPNFDCPGLTFYSGNLTGSVDDSVGAVCPDAVIIDGYEEVVFKMSFILSPNPNYIDHSICIDTIGYGGPEGFQWVWNGEACADIVPAWLDQDSSPMNTYGACFNLMSLPDCCHEFEHPPDSVVGDHCDPMSVQFVAYSMFDDQIIYTLESGPGQMDSVTGVWSWDDPSLEGVGDTIWIEVGAHNTWLQEARHRMRVIVTNEAPEFISGCRPYPAAAGERTEIPLSALDNCPTDPMEFSVLEATNVAGEYGFTDSVLWYVPAAEDRGDRRFTVAVTDGVDTSTCDVFFEVAEANCCGLYTNLHTGNCDCDAEGKRNLSDVTLLINNVYLSHWPLCCPANGNVDGDPENKINLSDITRLVDYIWISKTETSTCP